MRNGEVVEGGDEDFALEAMLETAEIVRATGAEIVWVSTPPRNGQDLSKCATHALIVGAAQSECDFNFGDRQDEHKRRLDLLRRYGDHFPIVELTDLMCTGTRCATLIDGNIMYRDSGHLSIEGSALLATSSI